MIMDTKKILPKKPVASQIRVYFSHSGPSQLSSSFLKQKFRQFKDVDQIAKT